MYRSSLPEADGPFLANAVAHDAGWLWRSADEPRPKVQLLASVAHTE